MTDTTRPSYSLIDGMDEAPWDNTLHCSCGQQLWPDCDISSVSIGECFFQHLADAHGITDPQPVD